MLIRFIKFTNILIFYERIAIIVSQNPVNNSEQLNSRIPLPGFRLADSGFLFTFALLSYETAYHILLLPYDIIPPWTYLKALRAAVVDCRT